MEEEEEIIVPINNDLEKKIAEVFDVFDHAGSRTVDAREVGTIIRSMGCCPSEAEIQELLMKMEDYANPGSVHLIRFLPPVAQAIAEHKFQPASPDILLEAFRVLDEKRQGFLTIEDLSTLVTQEGEVFTQDELDEMLEIAVDPQTHTIPYEYYINQLMYEQFTEETNIYILAERIESEKPPPPPPPKRFSEMFADMQSIM